MSTYEEQLAAQYHSVIFGDKDSYIDWKLVPNGRPYISSPKPNYIYSEIPGGNGSLDLTEVSTGNVTYQDRTGSLEFTLIDQSVDKITLLSTIMNYLQGQKMNLYLRDEPNYFYRGRFYVSDYTEENWLTVTIEYQLEPYKYNLTYTVIGPTSVTGDSDVINVGSINRELIPTINTTKSVIGTYKGHSYTLPKGESKLIALLDLKEDNKITITNVNLNTNTYSSEEKALDTTTNTEVDDTRYNVSELIEVEAGVTYYVSEHGTEEDYGIFWYDEDDDFLSSTAYGDEETTNYTAPSGAAKAKFTVLKTATGPLADLPHTFDAITYDFGADGYITETGEYEPVYRGQIEVTENSYNSSNGTANITVTFKTWMRPNSSYTGVVLPSTSSYTKPVIGIYISDDYKAGTDDSFYLDYRNLDTSEDNARTLTWTGDVTYISSGITIKVPINVPENSSSSLPGGSTPYTTTGTITLIKSDDPVSNVEIYDKSTKQVTISYQGGRL